MIRSFLIPLIAVSLLGGCVSQVQNPRIPTIDTSHHDRRIVTGSPFTVRLYGEESLYKWIDCREPWKTPTGVITVHIERNGITKTVSYDDLQLVRQYSIEEFLIVSDSLAVFRTERYRKISKAIDEQPITGVDIFGDNKKCV